MLLPQKSANGPNGYCGIGGALQLRGVTRQGEGVAEATPSVLLGSHQVGGVLIRARPSIFTVIQGGFELIVDRNSTIGRWTG